jgi:hypothetical protein
MFFYTVVCCIIWSLEEKQTLYEPMKMQCHVFPGAIRIRFLCLDLGTVQYECGKGWLMADELNLHHP